MRKLTFVSWLVVCCLFALRAPDADAIGLGGYVNYGGGTSTWKADNDIATWEFDTDKKIAGAGFVLDTAVARDVLFNYRLQVGVENWRDETDAGITLDLNGFVVTQDFGFGVLRTKAVRLWVGPELRLAFNTGSPENAPNLDLAIFNFGVGPVIGANFNIGSTLTLAVKTGYLFEGFVGTGQYSNSANPDIAYSGRSAEVFINVALLFRINDFY